MISPSDPEWLSQLPLPQEQMWPAPDDTTCRVQDHVRTIDPPRIPEHLLHPHLDAIHAMGTYYPTRHRKASNSFGQLIRKCKEGDRGSLDTLCLLMADFLASTIGTLLPIDLILHVPTDPRRLKERRFSVPEGLATVVSRRLCLPTSDCLILKRPVRSLRGLPPEKRVAELADAFALWNPGPIESKRVLLLDDVLAYGTTAGEIARLLHANGAQRVSVAVIAYAART